jgi:elongation factor G
VRLEPAVTFEVRCPAEHRSAVLADLGARGTELRQVSAGQLGALLLGRGRLGSFLGYATRLRSLTQGQGEVMLQPDGYEPVEGAEAEGGAGPAERG